MPTPQDDAPKSDAQLFQEKEVNAAIGALEKLFGALAKRQAAHAATAGQEQADLSAAIQLGAVLGTVRAFVAGMPDHHVVIEDIASSVARHRIRRIANAAVETPEGPALIVPGHNSNS